jgi:hypothetical protein
MYALRRTRRSLARETCAYLGALPPNRLLHDGIVLVHGGVRDVQQYMIGPSHIRVLRGVCPEFRDGRCIFQIKS